MANSIIIRLNNYIIYTLSNDIINIENDLDQIDPKVNGIKPNTKAFNTYNPNNGSEGNGYPAGTYGVGKCAFEVSDFKGTRIALMGAQFGWILQFSDTIGPANYIAGTKINADGQNIVLVDLASTAKYLCANVLDSYENAMLANAVSLPYTKNIVDNMEATVNDLSIRADDYAPSRTASNTYNPNTGSEGNGYPAGSYGVGKCAFEVSDFQGENVTITGAEFGWIMQFTNTPSPSTFISGTKANIDKATSYVLSIDINAKYVCVNVWDTTQNVRLYKDNSLALKSELPNIKNYDESNGYFVAIGDSITHGTGASTYSKNYFTLLARKLESAQVTSSRLELGVSSGNTATIAANIGAIENNITGDVTIPADLTQVNISLSIPIYDAGRNLVRVNPCWLNGIQGTLSKTNSGNNFLFARNEEGTSKFTPSGSTFITYSSAIVNNAKVVVVFCGTNDNLNTYPNNTEEVVETIDTIVNKIKTGKYLVVSPYVQSTGSDFINILGKKYGDRFYNLYNYFSKQGVIDAVIEGLIESGEQTNWSSLLTTDGVHPNDISHQLIAERLFERMEQIGLLN